MGLSFGLGTNLSLEEAEPVLLKAIELGCTFWDTAVVYQAGVNEKLLGKTADLYSQSLPSAVLLALMESQV